MTVEYFSGDNPLMILARGFRSGVCAALVLLACACGSPDRPASAPAPADRLPRETAPARDARPRPRIVCLGDSLTAGLGIAAAEAYPARLQERLDGAGLAFEVVNAGVSGDTSAGGLSRVDWALEGDVRILVVALGGNDALRGLPVAELKRNLSSIIERARARSVDVILAGMEAPPNFGADYTASFRQAYRDLSDQYGVVLVPFLLDGVAGLPAMNQRDGIHPTAEGARRVADNIWKALEPFAARAAKRGHAARPNGS
jgi:acyl-CoA thioesterase-1